MPNNSSVAEKGQPSLKSGQFWHVIRDVMPYTVYNLFLLIKHGMTRNVRVSSIYWTEISTKKGWEFQVLFCCFVFCFFLDFSFEPWMKKTCFFLLVAVSVCFHGHPQHPQVQKTRAADRWIPGACGPRTSSGWPGVCTARTPRGPRGGNGAVVKRLWTIKISIFIIAFYLRYLI